MKKIPAWVKVMTTVVLAVGLTVGSTYTTFETKDDHNVDMEHIEALIIELDRRNYQRFSQTQRRLDRLYELLAPKATNLPLRLPEPKPPIPIST